MINEEQIQDLHIRSKHIILRYPSAIPILTFIEDSQIEIKLPFLQPWQDDIAGSSYTYPITLSWQTWQENTR